MTKLFLDTDIFLDLILARVPHHASAAQLFTLIESQSIHGYTSPLTFSNLHDLLRRATHRAATLQHLRKLRLLVHIAAVDEKIVDQALASETFGDFEDALQHYTAVAHTMDGLITRNTRDYKRATLPVYTADEFLAAFQTHP